MEEEEHGGEKKRNAKGVGEKVRRGERKRRQSNIRNIKDENKKRCTRGEKQQGKKVMQTI